MPSSTSSFDQRPTTARSAWASWTFLLIAVLFMAAVELSSRLVVPRISSVERRTKAEYRAAVEAPTRPNSAQQVLVLGNSLLAAGIRFDEASQLLQPEADAKRWIVENTAYYDWYYGLRRLFGEGARPDVVVLMLSPRQLVSSQICGDIFAYRLMQMQDLGRVAGDTGLSNTEASNLAFANVSAFFGLRSGIRKFVAGQIFPDLPHLTAMMTHSSPPPLTHELIDSTVPARLEALRDLAAEYDARIILVLPPTGPNETADIPSAVEADGAAVGVSVLIPLAPGALGSEFFSDGFHLNQRGAEVFTERFVASLRTQLGQSQGSQ